MQDAEELRKQVDELKQLIEERTTKLRNAVKKGKGIEAQLQEAHARIAALEAAAAGAAAPALQNGSEHEDQHLDVQRLQAELHSATEAKDAKERDAVELRDKLKNAVHKGKSIETQLFKANERMAALEAQAAARPAAECDQVERLREQALVAAEERLQAHAELDTVKDLCQQREQETASLQKQLAKAQRDELHVLELRAELEATAADRDEQAAEAASLREQLAAEAQKHRGADEQLEQLNAELQSMAAERDARAAEASALQQQLAAAQQGLDAAEQAQLLKTELEDALQQLKVELERAVEAKQEQTREVEALGRQLAAALQAAAETERLAARQAAGASGDRGVEEQDGTEARISFLESQVQELQQENGNLLRAAEQSKRPGGTHDDNQVDVAELEDALVSAQRQLGALHAELEGMRAAKEEQQRKFAQAEERLEDALKQLAEAQAQVAEVQLNASSQEEGRSEQAKALHSANSDLKSQLAAAQARLAEAERQLSDGGSSSSASEEESAATATAAAAAAAEAAAARARVEEAEEQVAVMREGMRAAAMKVQEMRKEMEDAVTAREERDREAADLRRRLAEAEGRLSVATGVEEEAEAARERAELAEGQANKLKEQLREALEERERTGQRVKQLEAQLIEALSAADRADEASPQAAAQLEQAERLLEEAQQKLAAAEQLRAEAQAAANAAEQREQQAEGRVADAEERAAAADAELERVRAEAEERRKKFAMIHTTFAAKESRLKEAAEAADAEAAALREEVARLQAATLQLEAQAAAARDAAQAAAAELGGAATAAARQLEAQMEEAREAAERAEHDSWRAQEELQRVNSKMARLEELELAAERAEQAAVSLQRRLETAEASKAEVEAAAASLQQQVTRLEQQLMAERQQRWSAPDPVHVGPAGSTGSSGEVSPHMAATDGTEHPPTPTAGADSTAANALGGDGEGNLAEEVARLREQLAAAQKRVAAAAAVQHAKVAALEKQNRDLAWQVAMLTRGVQQQPVATGGPPSSLALLMPQADAGTAGHSTVTGWVASALRHRRRLLYVYLLLLHGLVYFVYLHPATGACSASALPSTGGSAGMHGGGLPDGGMAVEAVGVDSRIAL